MTQPWFIIAVLILGLWWGGSEAVLAQIDIEDEIVVQIAIAVDGELSEENSRQRSRDLVAFMLKEAGDTEQFIHFQKLVVTKLESIRASNNFGNEEEQAFNTRVEIYVEELLNLVADDLDKKENKNLILKLVPLIGLPIIGAIVAALIYRSKTGKHFKWRYATASTLGGVACGFVLGSLTTYFIPDAQPLPVEKPQWIAAENPEN